MPKHAAPIYVFQDITIQELKNALSRGSDIITAIHFAGNPGNVPVFHILDVELILHPEQTWIGRRRKKTIIWFDIYKICDARSALLLAEKHRTNGYMETVKLRSASEA